MNRQTAKLRLYPEVIARLGRRGQVLEGMWAGKGMKEIGADLGISSKTVEYHRAKLYQLFGVHDPVSLCRRAIAVGVIAVEASGRRGRTGRTDAQ